MTTPYRKAKLTPPGPAPWDETKLFKVLQFTLFPLIRLTSLLAVAVWCIFIVGSYPFLMTLVPFLSYLFFGKWDRYVRFVQDNVSRDKWYFVLGFKDIQLLTQNKYLRSFMGELEEK